MLDDQGNNVYTGVAKRGRIQDRLMELLPGGPDSIREAAKVKIEQKSIVSTKQEIRNRGSSSEASRNSISRANDRAIGKWALPNHGLHPTRLSARENEGSVVM